MSGVADVKDAVKCAKNEQVFGRRTVLFIDEIHRFNKLQQARFGIFMSLNIFCVFHVFIHSMFNTASIITVMHYEW